MSGCLVDSENSEIEYYEYKDPNISASVDAGKQNDSGYYINQCEKSNKDLHGCYFKKDSLKDKPMPTPYK
jgi:hypothetical protein